MPSNSWKLLHERLLSLQDTHGAVARFCERSGLSRQTVEYWLKHGTIPNIDKLDQIAAGFGLEPWETLRPADAESLSPVWREIVGQVGHIGEIDPADIPKLVRSIRGLFDLLEKKNRRGYSKQGLAGGGKGKI